MTNKPSGESKPKRLREINLEDAYQLYQISGFLEGVSFELNDRQADFAEGYASDLKIIADQLINKLQEKP